MTDKNKQPPRQDLEAQVKELMTDLSRDLRCAEAEPETAAAPVHEEPPLHPDGDARVVFLHDLARAALPPQPKARPSAFAVIGRAFGRNGIRRGDTPIECVRKSAFWLSLLVLLLSLFYVLYALWLLPMLTASRYDEAAKLYTRQITGAISGSSYPTGMRTAFCGLYDSNPDVRGFLQYHARGSEDFLDIEYPILRADDTYLDHDFFGYRNENGALIFDERNAVDTAEQQNRVLIIYGQNGLGGCMLSGLDRLAGSVHNARAAATLTMSTLYEENTYQVFAVLLTDADETGFDARRTAFASDEDFLAHVEAVRARSLFDYPVEITAEDELLVLSTVASPSVSKGENGRVMVFARRMEGDTYVNTAQIVKNEDIAGD